jgi:hypothetical protein
VCYWVRTLLRWRVINFCSVDSIFILLIKLMDTYCGTGLEHYLGGELLTLVQLEVYLFY